MNRYLCEGDNRSRRFASVRQAVPEDMLEFTAGGLFGDLGPQRDSERGSLCPRRTTPPAEFREQGRKPSNQSSNRGDQVDQCLGVHLGDSLGEKLLRTGLDYRGWNNQFSQRDGTVPEPTIIN